MRKYFLLLALLPFTACSTPDPYNPIAANQLFFCDHSEQMIVSLGDRGRRASVAFQGNNHTLERIPTRADGEAFSNSIYTLHIDDDRGAVLEREGVPYLTNCQRELD